MKAEFLKSLYHFEDYRPFSLPEFAFGGRSNVGKSSLINSLFQCKAAHTSKTPGKTRCINFFRVDDRIIIADLPGYGYAKVARQMQDDWKQLIESYIGKSPLLKKVFVLVDVQRGVLDEERMLMEWLDYLCKPYHLVFTKTDKLSKNELALFRKKHRSSAICYSSTTGEGRKELLALLQG